MERLHFLPPALKTGSPHYEICGLCTVSSRFGVRVRARVRARVRIREREREGYRPNGGSAVWDGTPPPPLDWQSGTESRIQLTVFKTPNGISNSISSPESGTPLRGTVPTTGSRVCTS